MRVITYGADPEFFFGDDNGALPVCGWLGGTKGKPLPLRGCGVQEDGVAAEITVEPSSNPYEMVLACRRAVNVVKDYARNRFTPANGAGTLGIYDAVSVVFPTAKLDKAGQQARTFGCSPDYDAYSRGREIPIVQSDALVTEGGEWRCVGGHVHIGYKAVNPNISEYVVAMLADVCVGARLVWGGERQGFRRQWYGAPGRFRPTAYGVEYRTPSAMWLWNESLADSLASGLERLGNILVLPENEIRARWNAIDWLAVKTSIETESRTGCEAAARSIL